MGTREVLSAAWIAGLAATPSCSPEPTSVAAAPLDDSYYTDKYDYQAQGLLGRGINLGNFLEAPREEGGEGAWNEGRIIQADDFAVIRSAGFATVRIPIRWSDYAGDDAASDPPYQIEAEFSRRVHEVVGWALAAGLNVVINVHHLVEMMTADTATIKSLHRPKLKAIWAQLCDAFPVGEEYPADRLMFELLNEPNGAIGYGAWNQIIAELVDVIWNDKQEVDRKLVVGTANWGGVPGLQELQLPTRCSADNTLITVHFYEPFHFTHQGAEWVDGSAAWIGEQWHGTPGEQQPLLRLLDDVVSWNQEPHRGFELFLGEFGAYSKHVDPDHQKAWTAFVAREAERRGMSWAYWEFCAGFGAYDPAAEAWRPAIYDALIPADAQHPPGP